MFFLQMKFLKVFLGNTCTLVFVVRSLNYGLKNKVLSVPQRHGVITFLPLGDRARHYLKNWCHMTLLNTVYNIASAVFLLD